MLRLGISYISNKQYPFVVVLRLNDFCNLKCTYCDSYKFSDQIDSEKLFLFLEKVYQSGTRLFILTGGEPYFYAHREKLMNWFAKRNAYLVINTNGQMINTLKYQKFLLQADDVLVSVDGEEEQNDLNRGQGTYKNAIATLDFLQTQKKRITISAVVTKNNFSIKQLEHILLLKKKYNAFVGISPVTADGRINSDSFYKNNKSSQEMLIQIRDFILNHFSVFNEFSKNILDYLVQPKPYSCQTMKYALYVDVDSNIYPCINVTDRKDAIVSNLKDYNFNATTNVYCTKCSCLPLITANGYFNKTIKAKDIFKGLFQRYFRFY